MAAQLFAAPAPPPVRDCLPATFRERGVAVPFTTPMLPCPVMRTRVRMTGQGSIEPVVLNPSGGRGVSILTCSNLRGLCRPTVHDARLVPILPREASESMALPTENVEDRPPIGLDATWRSDAHGLGLAARAERLRTPTI